jgi:hypothetical protein
MGNAKIWDTMVKESNVAKYNFQDMDISCNRANWQELVFLLLLIMM